VILHGIASPDASMAKSAAKKYRLRKAYSPYQELIGDREVDIVYVSTPSGLHYEWSSKALKSGKHVLCEKPFTSNSKEAKKLVQLATEKGLICVEAVRGPTGIFNLSSISFPMYSPGLVSLAISSSRASLP
jgi:predicted dehydrogenase